MKTILQIIHYTRVKLVSTHSICTVCGTLVIFDISSSSTGFSRPLLVDIIPQFQHALSSLVHLRRVVVWLEKVKPTDSQETLIRWYPHRTQQAGNSGNALQYFSKKNGVECGTSFEAVKHNRRFEKLLGILQVRIPCWQKPAYTQMILGYNLGVIPLPGCQAN